MKVSYGADHHAQAKREQSALVTLDITGKYAKRDGVTYQGTVTDPGAVSYLWAVFMWLTVGQHKGEPAPAYTPPTPPEIKPPKGRKRGKAAPPEPPAHPYGEPVGTRDDPGAVCDPRCYGE